MKKLITIFKYIFYILVAVSVCYVLVRSRKYHFSPFKQTKSISHADVMDFDAHDDEYYISTNKHIYFIDEYNQIVEVVSAVPEGLFSNETTFIAELNDIIYVYGFDLYQDSSYLESEKIASFSRDGKFLGYVYNRDYSREKKVLPFNVKALFDYEGDLYLLRAEGKKLSLHKIDINLNKMKTEGEIEFPEVIADAVYMVSRKEIIAQSIYNNFYLCDFKNKKYELLGYDQIKQLKIRIQGLKENWSNLVYHKKLNVENILFFVAVFIICLFVLKLLVDFIRAGNYSKYKIFIVLIIFILFSMGFLGDYIMQKANADAKEELNSIADVLATTIKYNFLDYNKPFFKDNTLNMTDELKTQLNNINAAIYEIVEERDKKFAVNMSCFIINNDGDAHMLVDSGSNNVFSTLESYNFKPNIENIINDNYCTNSYEVVGKHGKQAVEEVYVYDKDKKITYMARVSTDLDNFFDIILSLVSNVIIHLIAILAFLWAIFDGASRIGADIKEFIISKDKTALENRLKLTTTFTFLLETIKSLDSYVFVLVVAFIIQSKNSGNFAFIYGILVIIMKAAKLVGPMMTSFYIKVLGDRRGSILSLLISIAAFAAMAYACITKNIYIIGTAKFIQCLFLNCFVTSIMDDMKYDITDKDLQSDLGEKNSTIKDIGGIISAMTVGYVASYLGFTHVYIIGAVLSFVLLILSFIIFRNVHQITTERTKQVVVSSVGAWKFFLTPEVILLLILSIIPAVLVSGYEDYVFPVLAKRDGASEMLLSDVGVIINLILYLGIDELFIKFNDRREKAMTSVLLLGFIFITLLFNSHIVWLIIVLLLINIFSDAFGALNSYDLKSIAKKYNYDPKVISENYRFISAGLGIAKVPVINYIFSFSLTVYCIVMSTIILVLPGLYSKIRLIFKKNIKQEIS